MQWGLVVVIFVSFRHSIGIMIKYLGVWGGTMNMARRMISRPFIWRHESSKGVSSYVGLLDIRGLPQLKQASQKGAYVVGIMVVIWLPHAG